MPDLASVEAVDHPNRRIRRATDAIKRRGHQAPIHDAGNVGFYNKAQVCKLTTFTPTTLWRRIRVGDFPRGFQLSPNRVGWAKEDVHRWIKEKIDAANEMEANA